MNRTILPIHIVPSTTPTSRLQPFRSAHEAWQHNQMLTKRELHWICQDLEQYPIVCLLHMHAQQGVAAALLHMVDTRLLPYHQLGFRATLISFDQGTMEDIVAIHRYVEDLSNHSVLEHVLDMRRNDGQPRTEPQIEYRDSFR